ncbi:hypothetical protein V8J82_16895 [Gymnodinialimonas sp. 2305UL16-5]|uniref:hypothetical protein n=1 Tax=Gymnodinialimonas mytili TaxID=3126503 RepID=UPI0030B29A69
MRFVLSAALAAMCLCGPTSADTVPFTRITVTAPVVLDPDETVEVVARNGDGFVSATRTVSVTPFIGFDPSLGILSAVTVQMFGDISVRQSTLIEGTPILPSAGAGIATSSATLRIGADGPFGSASGSQLINCVNLRGAPCSDIQDNAYGFDITGGAGVSAAISVPASVWQSLTRNGTFIALDLTVGAEVFQGTQIRSTAYARPRNGQPQFRISYTYTAPVAPPDVLPGTIAPVPVPAGSALLLSALAMGGLIARHRSAARPRRIGVAV